MPQEQQVYYENKNGFIIIKIIIITGLIFSIEQKIIIKIFKKIKKIIYSLIDLYPK